MLKHHDGGDLSIAKARQKRDRKRPGAPHGGPLRCRAVSISPPQENA